MLAVVLMLAKMGVSLEKLDRMKPWFAKWIPHYAGLLPTGANARRDYLPRLLPLHESSVNTMLEGILGCSIIADESTDKRKRSPVNLLIAPAKEIFQPPLLVDILFVDESEASGDSVNGRIMEEFVLKVCSKFEMDLS